MYRLAVLNAVALVLFMPVSHAGSVPLVGIDPGAVYSISFDEPNTDGMWGWTFYVHSPVVVTHVAWYDEGGDGLSHSHRIGLWKDLSGSVNWPFVSATQNEQILKTGVNDSVVVPAGDGAELVNGLWRRRALPNGPIVLSPGGYALGGLDSATSADAIRYHLAWVPSGVQFPTDPRIEIGAPSYSGSSGFQFPGFHILVDGVELGPMLFVQPIPESATLTLAGLSMGGLFILRSQRA